MQRALVLGGTGSLLPTVAALSRQQGLQVHVTCRSQVGWPAWFHHLNVITHVADRDDPVVEQLAAMSDIIVDGLCYTPRHAQQLATWSRDALVVMISSAAVYTDDAGRHQNSDEAADWGHPLVESDPTMDFHGEAWNTATGYGANKAEAERILLAHGRGALVLRPGKIHAPGMRNAREWSVVGPALAGGPVRVANPDTRESTTAGSLIAAAVLQQIAFPRHHVLNVADADTPTPFERAQTLAGLVGGNVTVNRDDSAKPLPWTSDRRLDTTALRASSVIPKRYADSVGPAVDWLRQVARRNGGSWQLPGWIDAQH